MGPKASDPVTNLIQQTSLTATIIDSALPEPIIWNGRLGYCVNEPLGAWSRLTETQSSFESREQRLAVDRSTLTALIEPSYFLFREATITCFAAPIEAAVAIDGHLVWGVR
ncbi:MAG: hypothetical protein QOI31_1760 [Solirubrobacterales bacterium]|nr:hypothetical protein [Solirubrobacterales bacterium]